MNTSYLGYLSAVSRYERRVAASGHSGGDSELENEFQMLEDLLNARNKRARALPAGALLISPFVDLTMSFDSYQKNLGKDYLSFPEPKERIVHAYAGGKEYEYLTKNDLFSPIFNHFDGKFKILYI